MGPPAAPPRLGSRARPKTRSRLPLELCRLLIAMAATVERLALIQKQLFAGNDDVAIYFFEVCARASEYG
jgi:hypothetical protein